MFSTGSGGLFARTTHAGPADDASTTLSPGINPYVPHDYRIEWSATDVKYYVDDFSAPVATHAAAIAGPMGLVISDAPDGNVVSVDSLGLLSDTFESPVHDLGEAPAAWHPLTTTVDEPAGTHVILETRSGSTPTPDSSWSAYQPLGANNAIESPLGRYLQYRAKLSTTDAQVTPSLDDVQLDYTAPSTSITDVEVSGTTAAVSFSSPAPDVDRFECRVDDGGFAPCTSPYGFTGLAESSHTVYVRAVDHAGNVGVADSKAFSVDTTAPTTSISDVQVSGTAATVSFSSAASDVARFECRVDGDAYATCTSPKQFTGSPRARTRSPCGRSTTPATSARRTARRSPSIPRRPARRSATCR